MTPGWREVSLTAGAGGGRGSTGSPGLLPKTSGKSHQTLALKGGMWVGPRLPGKMLKAEKRRLELGNLQEQQTGLKGVLTWIPVCGEHHQHSKVPAGVGQMLGTVSTAGNTQP